VRWVYALPTCARSCLLRGDFDANTTRPCLTVFSTGRFNSGGGPGGGLRNPGVPDGDVLCTLGAPGASSYGGGGSDGKRLDMTTVDVCLGITSRKMRASNEVSTVLCEKRGEFNRAIEWCVCAESEVYPDFAFREEGPSSNATYKEP
jgi:hypothetical protein